ncbi:glycerol-3-phosphate dehydrogenase/oxidase [Riemerella anatipestifer]|uniref:glycerol-3-phosphate dehydrogenase/oxidase n=1 Tax=Riemerella anatipestifer TaxID=34085 RepID=UPI00129E9DBF|nr:glycerol-3-phosphate dehydrogenase/oxidase [Riemerella anatipestifer]MBT0552063.1 glycerol-3-phosphate dehydrogenase/oxidase [Riemerella anatipestifer]MBT0554350.1 glycerol-3-phosphate dehydrogenase/oxidase [Riemerella anatipestifer]MCE3024873.1 glycerol-3-phosphate dehydrogenase/oxidase [Riemerella anatipestifer]MCU7543035.1 glycerol-3-phosphate dehydrogenase/oxidase [Riemerella anatipestifer]MCU7560606.1 glycerol-3-phosphate dehydrogenase/oxidase [Riemerella anatipestifer]
MNRNSFILELNKVSQWDFIVIGGGASGLGAALDATSRGYKTLLLESHDFSKGTSSRSTKLVHGGVRYLAQGDVGLVKEALRERGLLAKNAAHLFKNQSFVIPNYTWWGGPYYKIGLSVYDFLAGSLSLGKTRYINKNETIKKLPTVEPKSLSSGVVYQDGQFDDARLALNIAQTIVEKGGAVLNYARVIDLLKDEKGKISGVKMRDELSGEEYELSAKVVVNATGVFTNDILNMNNPKHKKFVVPSQGIHLVLDKSFLPSNDALMIPKTSDGRVLFAVPWHDKVVVGTTDTLIEEPSFEPKALEKEIEFVLETARRFLVKKPTREDVKSVFAGLRPLAAPDKEGGSTKEVSRSHKVVVSETGLVTITGGKWTTYRKMAEDTIDEALKVHSGIEKKPCNTEHLSIHGNIPAEKVDMSNHLYVYGSDIPHIQKLMNEDGRLSEKLHKDYPYTLAEVYWAVHQEMAQTVEDVLARRVRLLFLDARAAIDVAEKVAQFMAQELGKGQQWVDGQVREFVALAEGYLLVPYTAQK